MLAQHEHSRWGIRFRKETGPRWHTLHGRNYTGPQVSWLLVDLLSTLSNSCLLAGVAFYPWKGPEDVLWENLGLLRSLSSSVGSMHQVQSQSKVLSITPTWKPSAWALWWSVSICPSIFFIHPQHLSEVTFKSWIRQAPLSRNLVQPTSGTSRRSDDERRVRKWS